MSQIKKLVEKAEQNKNELLDFMYQEQKFLKTQK